MILFKTTAVKTSNPTSLINFYTAHLNTSHVIFTVFFILLLAFQVSNHVMVFPYSDLAKEWVYATLYAVLVFPSVDFAPTTNCQAGDQQ
jgi:hypothetical protein